MPPASVIDLGISRKGAKGSAGPLEWPKMQMVPRTRTASRFLRKVV